jgi:hypothetical protein
MGVSPENRGLMPEVGGIQELLRSGTATLPIMALFLSSAGCHEAALASTLKRLP